MTNTRLGGDVTAWCAAFVSFCLFLANKENRFSALSGAYRDYGQRTDDPQMGDLAVFAEYGERGRQGFGHVAFFAGMQGDQISVLGGNQVGNTGSSGAITTAIYDRHGKVHELHSFRRVA